MAQDVDDIARTEQDSVPPARRRFRKRNMLWAILAIAATGLLFAWLTREKIADDFLTGQLEQLGLPATYEIESIGPDEQVLRNLVIGDPANPDLTVERVTVRTYINSFMPGIGRIELTRPRLFGTYRSGKLSFGSLDPLIFTDSDEPFSLPDLDVAIIDGRGLLETDYGNVGVKLAGEGKLRGGFGGELAAIAPEVDYGDCTARGASIYGKITVKAEKPGFHGPLRLDQLTCKNSGLRARKAAIGLSLTLDPQLDGGEGSADIATKALAFGESRMASSGGKTRFVYRADALTARYDLTGKTIATSFVAAASMGAEGHLRSTNGLARLQLSGNVRGKGLALGPASDAALASASQATAGTFAEPVALQIRNALRSEARGSSLAGDFDLRLNNDGQKSDGLTLVLPRAVLRGGSGDTLLSVSRLQMQSGGGASPRISGNFTTGGKGLPQLSGRMEQQSGRSLMLRVKMPEYRAGKTRITLPELLVLQSGNGGVGFAGSLQLSGDLPGGQTENLFIPLNGNYSARSGLAVWRGCTQFAFDRLRLANLSFDRRKLTVCPARGRPILQYGPQGLSIAGGVPALDLAGRLGETPIRIASGPAGFSWPGNMVARDLDISLGPAGTASRFTISGLEARLGSDISGSFEDADVLLDAVPLDILDSSGRWRFANGELALSNGSFRLEDREALDRFEPLTARDAVLQLVDNVITAKADLREPSSDRQVVTTSLRHDLSTGRGHADLDVAELRFDETLQPDTLSGLALGVIANAQGAVSGTGRIDWNEAEVTSSGRFTTDAFNFAAAFGPVKGLSGTVEFTDLLGLVTAPDQRLAIASINPGIEVTDGVLSFELRPDYVLEVNGANWPFLEGTLELKPVTMHIGEEEALKYVLVIEGLNAARFIEQMELGNLAATGTFDGTLPLIFDKDGGRIEGGFLQSRPPGGNVSYVGELTYEDLSTMANFAFDALRSIDYRDMTIGMDGALEGEIVTRVRFRGVSQGEGTTSNFLTRRISKLPIQFNINLRAPFMQLISSFKSLYDPAMVRDPRSLGLVDEQGRAKIPPNQQAPGMPPSFRQPAIQPSESEDTP